MNCLKHFQWVAAALATVASLTVFSAEIKYMEKSTAPASQLALWYRTAASDWEREALPLGNGYIGAKVFGGVVNEVVQLNDITLWTGGPGTNKGQGVYNYGINPNIDTTLISKIRELVEKHDYVGAQDTLASRYPDNMPRLLGTNFGYGAYQNLGELNIDFNLTGDEVLNVKNYRRELDIENAVARVCYQLNGVNYKREYFCSYPDKVLVVKLTADAPMNFEVRLKSAQENATGYSNTAIGNTITVKGALADNGERFESQIQVITSDGAAVDSRNSAIKVSNAKEAVLILSTATDYKLNYPTYRSGIDPHETVAKILEAAIAGGYDKLYNNHVTDYRSRFGRVNLNLGNSKPEIPTDELLLAYKEKPNRELEVLFFQYGRYLLISSSRTGGLPANLQGIWNNTNRPMFSSDYHYNINLQMNYWPAEVTNLSECAEPLIELVNDIVPSGRKTAAAYFQVGDGVAPEGWTVNCTGNIYGFSSVGAQLSWGWAPAGNAFISQNLWDHYTFSKNKEYLAKKIYPVIKEAALFWTKYLIIDSDGTLTSPPGYSPEQMHISKGVSYDQQLAWELFTNTIEASEVLGVDPELRKELLEKRSKLYPIKIGKKYSQIVEWKNCDTDDISSPGQDAELCHRHLSHLISLYPGKQINRTTRDWLEASRISLDRRTGDNSRSTGWTTAWKINARARTFEGDRAHQMLALQLKKHTMSNLWDAHGNHKDPLWTFQIEGNFGATSGVAEMLIQSHMDYIDLLPALPNVWSTGSVSGLRARGAYTVSMDWRDKILSKATVRTEFDGAIKLRNDMFKAKDSVIIVNDEKQNVGFTVENNIITFIGKAGASYEVNCRP